MTLTNHELSEDGTGSALVNLRLQHPPKVPATRRLTLIISQKHKHRGAAQDP